ncbi:MAG: diguanylate cyclase [Thermoleophilia bacterium]
MLCVDDQWALSTLSTTVLRIGFTIARPDMDDPDVLVTDWPPPMRAQHLMQRRAGRTQVVAVIRDGDEKAADDALDAGAVDCIMQPVRGAEAGMRLSAAVRRNRDRMRLADPAALIDSLHSGLAVLSPDGSIAQVNRAMTVLTGTGADRLIGVRVGQDPLLGPDPHRVVALFRRARHDGTADGPLTMRAPDGAQQPVTVRVTAMCDDAGAVSAYILTVRHPTEPERAHSALHRIAATAANPSAAGVFCRMAAEAAALVCAACAAVLRSEPRGQMVVGAHGLGVAAGTCIAADERAAAERAMPAAPATGLVRVPLTAGGRSWGQLVVQVPQERLEHAESALRRFATLASMVAAEADARAWIDPNRDSLTGLPGNHTFADRLTQAVAESKAAGTPLSVVVVDVDRLKRVNDTHGHITGDMVLKELARRMQVVVRDGDVLCRTGGQEFAWLLQGADMIAATVAARRMRLAVSEAPVEGVGGLTASFGVAQLGCGEPGADGPSDVIRQAEVALQWAKMNGGNRAVSYSFEVAEDVFARSADLPAEAPTLRAMRALAWAVDARDSYTQQHSGRVADLAVRIATALGWTPERCIQLREAGLLHDVGKIAVPDTILHKPDSLTDAEYEVVKRHAAVGASIVTEVLSAEQGTWIRGHHERMDGNGYPDGLVGDEIPEEARVLAVADSWDTMVSARAYKTARSTEDAIRELRRCVGSQFWGPAVDALERLLDAGLLEDWANDSVAGLEQLLTHTT